MGFMTDSDDYDKNLQLQSASAGEKCDYTTPRMKVILDSGCGMGVFSFVGRDASRMCCDWHRVSSLKVFLTLGMII